jgi:hypothetical protein
MNVEQRIQGRELAMKGRAVGNRLSRVEMFDCLVGQLEKILYFQVSKRLRLQLFSLSACALQGGE